MKKRIRTIEKDPSSDHKQRFKDAVKTGITKK
jgi:hypothetical protein